jgi:hypothetical protein
MLYNNTAATQKIKLSPWKRFKVSGNLGGHFTDVCKIFFLNNQPDALIIQIYSIIKLYMFRAFLCPSSGVFHCKFGTGKFHADFDDRFQAESGWNSGLLILKFEQL